MFNDHGPPFHAVHNGPQPTPPAPAAYPADHLPLPKVGQTRCYWTMLSAELQFIYLDPVLASHLGPQAEALVGKSLLSFVHPDEQASAKQDLGGVLDSRTLHGSVTRVRFSRLSKVRRQLGYDGPPPDWSEAEKVALDKDYMAVDIVINWAAEGLVLCFIHATTDLTPDDNDENSKTDWTNWCGTPQMSMEQIDLLYHRLVVCIPQSGSMTRVFQILANQRDRPLLMSWPPDQPTGPKRRDFAKLVENVQIGTGVPGGNDAKTSCTRRYKALQEMPPGFGGEVESIFIPHGSIIFACHKVNPSPRSNTANSTAPMQQLDYASAPYHAHQSSAYYDHGASYSLPSLSPQSQAYTNGFLQQQQQQQGVQAYPTPRWAQAPQPLSMNDLRSGSYPGNSTSQSNWPATQNGAQSGSYLEPAQPQFNRPLSPAYSYSPTTASSVTGGTSPTSDVVPPPRRRISPGSTRDQTGPIRTTGNRPTGVQKCSSCKATSSPEWRKGPSGKKELCNACGLRYARSRAKKEGPNQVQQRRRNKDSKALSAKRESVEPPAFPSIRRDYPDSSFSASSTGSASGGSDIYPHSSHRVVDIKQSPSPPASNMSFVHYAPGGTNGRQAYSNPGNDFYSSMPSPLSASHVLNPPQQQQPLSQQQQHINTTQLPPLGHLSSYAGRLSPMMPSSVSHSSLASAVTPNASYERERDARERDYRELPPTPLSADGRIGNRRSILTQH
ncbi:hypothetical protein BDN70DRAFT_934821 [Pholiota conissans]|uniref:GATA-type domain-containing protein n=1 Tax=Pholiota conissans TaxID=109636 RepID=A0A9P5YY44_9AGAR|nr:hypothetical protein BDN70DRAFT_934821 [Pholiota conissans]